MSPCGQPHQMPQEVREEVFADSLEGNFSWIFRKEVKLPGAEKFSDTS